MASVLLFVDELYNAKLGGWLVNNDDTLHLERNPDSLGGRRCGDVLDSCSQVRGLSPQEILR